MKVPTKKQGNAGKRIIQAGGGCRASMKVPTKKQGNIIIHRQHDSNVTASMKVPPERKGNLRIYTRLTGCKRCLNEIPSGKEGK